MTAENRSPVPGMDKGFRGWRQENTFSVEAKGPISESDQGMPVRTTFSPQFQQGLRQGLQPGFRMIGSVFPVRENGGLGKIGQDQVCFGTQAAQTGGLGRTHAGVEFSMVPQNGVHHEKPVAVRASAWAICSGEAK